MIDALKIVTVGHVDHGKSTLIGRLLHETGAIPAAKLEMIRAVSLKRGVTFEWAFLLDALQVERDQGVTIDTTRIRFASPTRPYLLIDAPGHREFLKNMITGAASADAAILVVDAGAGIGEQTRRHAYLLQLLGLKNIVAVINKMDLVDWSADIFEGLRRDLLAYLEAIGIAGAGLAVIPVSAREGEGITRPAGAAPWYRGKSLIAALDALPAPRSLADQPLRLPVQDVYKFDHRRLVVGRIETGRLRRGDTLLFSPADKRARIASIEAWAAPSPPLEAAAGQSIALTLDPPIFVERGQLASHVEHPPIQSDIFRARIFWLGAKPLAVGASYRLKFLTQEVDATVERVERVIDTTTLESHPASSVGREEVGEIVLKSRIRLALDEYAHSPRTGRFVLAEDFRIVGGGIISMEGYPDRHKHDTVAGTNLTPVAHRVTLPERWRANRHKSGILWLTGLSGSGKSTLAMELERWAFLKGFQVAVLDGDNLRRG
ncbi:MAG TPA: GTP-binding protein, partial [Stellaceae bacterium]|nr:GTP-binding protein [Stellaceae bacterium]